MLVRATRNVILEVLGAETVSVAVAALVPVPAVSSSPEHAGGEHGREQKGNRSRRA